MVWRSASWIIISIALLTGCASNLDRDEIGDSAKILDSLPRPSLDPEEARIRLEDASRLLGNDVREIVPALSRGLDPAGEAILGTTDIVISSDEGLTEVEYVRPTGTSRGEIRISAQFILVS